MRPCRDAPVSLISALQILARTRQQIICGERIALLLADHYIAILSSPFAVVDGRDRSRRIAECRMCSHVLDQFAADIDPPPVAYTFQIVFAAHKHLSLPMEFAGDRTMPEGGNSRFQAALACS